MAVYEHVTVVCDGCGINGSSDTMWLSGYWEMSEYPEDGEIVFCPECIKLMDDYLEKHPKFVEEHYPYHYEKLEPILRKEGKFPDRCGEEWSPPSKDSCD